MVGVTKLQLYPTTLNLCGPTTRGWDGKIQDSQCRIYTRMGYLLTWHTQLSGTRTSSHDWPPPHDSSRWPGLYLHKIKPPNTRWHHQLDHTCPLILPRLHIKTKIPFLTVPLSGKYASRCVRAVARRGN